MTTDDIEIILCSQDDPTTSYVLKGTDKEVYINVYTPMSIIINEYEIIISPERESGRPNHIYIKKSDGEGVQFNYDELTEYFYQTIHKFYQDNFNRKK